jgi:hypothetical protein
MYILLMPGYAYGLNNPVNSTDPTGHTACVGENYDDGPQCLKDPDSQLSITVANTQYQHDCAAGTNSACPGGTTGMVTFFVTSVIAANVAPIQTLLATVATAIWGPPKSPQEMMASVAGSQYAWNASTGQYRDLSTGQFLSPKDLPWPSGRGFGADSVNTTLPKGYIIDRYGKLTGDYAGEPGTSISARGMAPGSEDMPYTQLRVVEPVTVPAGPAAAVSEFGASGGGIQYEFTGGIQSWIDAELLEIIP